MRCLHCGKELALLKRLTGGAEFCSEAHKQSYHEEYNRIALGRLLQAQSKSEEIRNKASVATVLTPDCNPIPTQIASFLIENTSLRALNAASEPAAGMPGTPMVWSPRPEVPNFRPALDAIAPADPAGLVAFDIQTQGRGGEPPKIATKVAIQEFSKRGFSMKLSVKPSPLKGLPAAGPVDFTVGPRNAPIAPLLDDPQIPRFRFYPSFSESTRCSFEPTGIACPPEELEAQAPETENSQAGRPAAARAQSVPMPLKVFAPPKARLAAMSHALTLAPKPELPRPDALPLRPKISIGAAPIKVPGQLRAEPTAEATKPASVEAVNPPQKSAPTPAPLVSQREILLDGPNLSLTGSNGGFWAALPLIAKLGVTAVALVIGAALLYMAFSGSHKTGAGAVSGDIGGPSIMMGEGGWVTDWAGDATGLHRGRQITIYRPSLKLSDYRIDFQGRILSNSIGWVFRAADASNYYAMKLSQTSSGAKLSKYSVVNGVEHEQGQVAAPAPSSGLFHVRLDVRGPRFNIFIQGQPVDLWTDDRLKSGGVGFLNDRGDRADIKGISISYLTGVNQ